VLPAALPRDDGTARLRRVLAVGPGNESTLLSITFCYADLEMIDLYTMLICAVTVKAFFRSSPVL